MGCTNCGQRSCHTSSSCPTIRLSVDVLPRLRAAHNAEHAHVELHGDPYTVCAAWPARTLTHVPAAESDAAVRRAGGYTLVDR